MSPILNPTYGYCVLFAASDDLPKNFPFREIADRVREGVSMVWVEGKNTLMVTTPLGDDTLFIDLVLSKTAGAIHRNWESLKAFMKQSDIRYAKCRPFGLAQARLYGLFGFVDDTDDCMIYDREAE